MAKDKAYLRELEDISRKLDVVVRLVAYRAVEGKGVNEGAPILRNMGLMPAEIAEIYGTTANTVRVAVAQAKAAHKKRPRKGPKMGGSSNT